MINSETRTYIEGLNFQVVDDTQGRVLLSSRQPPTDEAWRAVWHVLNGKIQFVPFTREIQTKASNMESKLDYQEVEELAEKILIQALNEKASDIHLEPNESQLKVRFRLDGQLVRKHLIPDEKRAHLMAHLKIRSNMDIAEKRRPQDGRIQINHHGQQIDFRVSTLPTHHGEKMVLRLLDKRDILMDLDHLSMPKSVQEPLRRTIASPYGLILVTGPTGSGKTTTLYSCLQAIQSESLNIMTVEDPIEYQLEGISQTQVKPEIGVTFASTLRTFLRQDPNVIMIGEMRDTETAELGVRASLTGHLVFSTLHTNDTCSAIPRLLDMGIPAHLLSGCLSCVLSQRLIRKLCEHCKQPDQQAIPHLQAIYKASGCGACYRTGYKGRCGLFEWLPIDQDLQKLISKRADVIQIHESAIKKGLIPLKESAMGLVKRGITSYEEAIRETGL